MTQRKAILTCTSSVAFLIPACLSFVQAPEALGQNGFEVEVAAARLPHQNRLIDRNNVLSSRKRCREQQMSVNDYRLDARQALWSITGYQRDEALKSTP